ncbi:site-specific integrase [bacterium]|nr:MAG: site-specific integrase [bacterium]
MARNKGEGGYEKRERRGKTEYRYRLTVAGQKDAGPFRSTKTEAKKAYTKQKGDEVREAARANLEELKKEEDEGTPVLASLVYFCLFGVWEAEVAPTTKGPWVAELAPTTYKLYKGIFKTDIVGDPIALMLPEQIQTPDLEAWRMRMLARRLTYERRVRVQGGGYGNTWTTEIVERPLRNPRTVERYMPCVTRALKRVKNNCGDDLQPLKLPPPRKTWLDWKDRKRFLSRFADAPNIERAVRLMLRGMCLGEVCAVRGTSITDEGARILTQFSSLDGGAEERGELKRERRYRAVPLPDDLAEEIRAFGSNRAVPMSPSGLYHAIVARLVGTPWESITPHDMRRSGAKWMLDRGAKLSDVADILGNDPMTLARWYDKSDVEGKKRALSYLDSV